MFRCQTHRPPRSALGASEACEAPLSSMVIHGHPWSCLRRGELNRLQDLEHHLQAKCACTTCATADCKCTDCTSIAQEIAAIWSLSAFFIFRFLQSFLGERWMSKWCCRRTQGLFFCFAMTVDQGCLCWFWFGAVWECAVNLRQVKVKAEREVRGNEAETWRRWHSESLQSS